MALLSHRGGSMTITGKNGKPETIHYGPGLHQPCKECNQPENKLCVTKNGKPLNKIHKVRLK